LLLSALVTRYEERMFGACDIPCLRIQTWGTQSFLAGLAWATPFVAAHPFHGETLEGMGHPVIFWPVQIEKTIWDDDSDGL